MRRLTGHALAAALVVPLLSVLVLVSTETAAHACTCLQGSLAKQVATADVVLVGTVSAVESSAGGGTSVEESPSSAPSSASSPGSPSASGSGGTVTEPDAGTTTAVVEVDRVFKGEAMQRERVTTANQAAACGVSLVADERYLVIGRRTDASIDTASCDGTVPLRSDTIRRLRQVTGSRGTAPTAVEAPSEATMSRLDDGDPPTFTRVAAPGAALVIVGLLGLVLARRRRGPQV